MDKLAEKMAELAEKFGPSVVDAARGAVRVEAYSSMAAGIIAIAAAVAMYASARFIWRKVTEDSWDEVCYVLAGMAFIGAFIAICIGAWSFIDPWVWTALNNPDLYLAKKIFKI